MQAYLTMMQKNRLVPRQILRFSQHMIVVKGLKEIHVSFLIILKIIGKIG